jgi:CheY-like chemotaxis protein
VQAELGEHVARGDIVYHGLAGHLLLAGMPGLLRVRLIAPLEMRVKTLVDRHGLSRDAAIEYIEQVDEERMRWTRLVYGVELRDSSRFDLVVNLEKSSLETACRLVTVAAAAPEYQLDSEDRARYRAFALRCRAELEAGTAGGHSDSAGRSSVLVAADDVASAAPFVEELERRSARVTVVTLGPETEACAVAAPFDALLACTYRPASRLLEVLRALHQTAPKLPVVVVAAHAAVDARIEAMQLGAADFLDHPQPADAVAEAVEAAIELGRAAGGRPGER